MTESIDVFWSFRSPYSYLVTPDLQRLRDDYEVDINIRIVYPIAVRDPSLLFDPANRRKALYIVRDSQRRAEFLGLPFAFPRPDPIVQDLPSMTVSNEQPYIYRLSALGVEAQRRGLGVEFVTEVARLIFGGTERWDEGEHLQKATLRAGLVLEVLDQSIAKGGHADEIERNQEALAAAGHWGVPTMVLRDEPFFGQDRVDTLRWRLNQYGLARN